MHVYRIALALFCMIGMAGCSTMEHRSDLPEKTPLPSLVASVHPHLIWSVNTGVGVGNTDAQLRVIAVGDKLITADYKGQLSAISKQNGHRSWRIQTHKTITSGPSYANGVLLLATGDAKLMAYREGDGQFLWETPLSGEMLTLPVVHGDRVYAHTVDGSITAIQFKNGEHVWRYTTPSPVLTLRRSSMPVVSDGYVIVGFANGKLAALREDTGVLVWEREIGTPKGRTDIARMVDISADPKLLGHTLYVVSYQGQLKALDIRNGELQWSKDISSYSGLCVVKNRLYIADSMGQLWALKSDNGEVLWQQKALFGRQLTTPSIVEEFVVVGDEEGYLHYLSTKDGQLAGRARADKKGIQSTPFVLQNQLFVLGRGGMLAAYQL